MDTKSIGDSMKVMKKIIVMLAFYAVPANAFLFSSNNQTPSTMSLKEPAIQTQTSTSLTFVTEAAYEAYDDCMHGASGDFTKTGCKSDQCDRACKKIGMIVDTAKKEGIYQPFAVCVYGNNIRSKYGNWLPRGCPMRKVTCWDNCSKWAREKVKHGIVVPVKPFPNYAADDLYTPEQTPVSVPKPSSMKCLFSCKGGA